MRTSLYRNRAIGLCRDRDAKCGLVALQALNQDVDGRGRDDSVNASCQFLSHGHEGVCLKLCERDVLGVVGRCPPQSSRQVPGTPSELCITEEPYLHLLVSGQTIPGHIGVDLTSLRCLVQSRQHLRPKESRSEQRVFL